MCAQCPALSVGAALRASVPLSRPPTESGSGSFCFAASPPKSKPAAFSYRATTYLRYGYTHPTCRVPIADCRQASSTMPRPLTAALLLASLLLPSPAFASPPQESCNWTPSLSCEQPPRLLGLDAGWSKPHYRMEVHTSDGVDVLEVCPLGWLDCDRPEHSAAATYASFLARNPTLDPFLVDVDNVRQHLVAAEPYRSTVQPTNACAEQSAPKTRGSLVEHFLAHYGGANSARYLEIGCDEDATFMRVKSLSHSAICVDPSTGGTHRLTSDDFFAHSPASIGPFDVVFVDGLHESVQAERDVRNALSRLAPGGVVVMHDTNPRVRMSAAWPREWTHKAPQSWNGDTYKAAARLRVDKELDVVTADIDHGCTIVRRRSDTGHFDYTSNAAKLPDDLLEWRDFEENRASWLGLMAVSDALQWFHRPPVIQHSPSYFTPRQRLLPSFQKEIDAVLNVTLSPCFNGVKYAHYSDADAGSSFLCLYLKNHASYSAADFSSSAVSLLPLEALKSLMKTTNDYAVALIAFSYNAPNSDQIRNMEPCRLAFHRILAVGVERLARLTSSNDSTYPYHPDDIAVCRKELQYIMSQFEFVSTHLNRITYRGHIASSSERLVASQRSPSSRPPASSTANGVPSLSCAETGTASAILRHGRDRDYAEEQGIANACEERERDAMLYARFGEHAAALDILEPCRGRGWKAGDETAEVIERHGRVLAENGLSGDFVHKDDTEGTCTPHPETPPVTSSKDEKVLGVFLLQSRTRPYIRNYSSLQRSLRLFSLRYPEAVPRLKLFVLTSPSDGRMDGRDEEEEAKWRTALGKEGEELLGGVFKVGTMFPFISPHHGNYLRKIFTAVALADRTSISFMLSLDDDVILSPETFLHLISATSELSSPFITPSGDEGGERGGGDCALITPTLSTGVPSVELWAEAFLSPEERTKLFKCFQGSSDREGLVTIGSGPWSSDQYYEMLWSLVPENLLVQPVSSVGLAIHPVRWNTTCTGLVDSYAFLSMEREFKRARENELRLRGEGVSKRYKLSRHSGQFPYFANSVWVAPVAFMKEVLMREDLFSKRHPFDEAPMNIMLWHEGNWRRNKSAGHEGKYEEPVRDSMGRVKENICIMEEFAIHPSYAKEVEDDWIVMDLHYLAARIFEDEASTFV